MSKEDIVKGGLNDGTTTMVSWCYDNLFTIITIVPVLWVIRRLFYRIQPRWFVYFLHLLNSNGLGPFMEESKDHFASLSSIVSHDPELRKKKAIRILEIGVGTGVNSCHYPDGSYLVAVDRNPHLKSYWENCRKKLPNIHTGELLVASAENMEQIADNSIDVVVVTLMLCSVPDIDTILREILRVLASGGKYYFIEHIVEFDLQKHGLRRKLQDVGHWLGFWSFLFDGCHMNRDILTNIERAGFSSVDAQKFYKKTWFISSFTSPSLKGIATK